MKQKQDNPIKISVKRGDVVNKVCSGSLCVNSPLEAEILEKDADAIATTKWWRINFLTCVNAARSTSKRLAERIH